MGASSKTDGAARSSQDRDVQNGFSICWCFVSIPWNLMTMKVRESSVGLVGTYCVVTGAKMIRRFIRVEGSRFLTYSCEVGWR